MDMLRAWNPAPPKIRSPDEWSSEPAWSSPPPDATSGWSACPWTCPCLGARARGPGIPRVGGVKSKGESRLVAGWLKYMYIHIDINIMNIYIYIFIFIFCF